MLTTAPWAPSPPSARSPSRRKSPSYSTTDATPFASTFPINRHIRLGYSVSTYRAQGASIAKIHAIVAAPFSRFVILCAGHTRRRGHFPLHDQGTCSTLPWRTSKTLRSPNRCPASRISAWLRLADDAPPSSANASPAFAGPQSNLRSLPYHTTSSRLCVAAPVRTAQEDFAPAGTIFQTCPQSSQPPQAPKLPAANSLPSRRSSSPPKPLTARAANLRLCPPQFHRRSRKRLQDQS